MDDPTLPGPVSYTHLDVYKRQLPGGGAVGGVKLLKLHVFRGEDVHGAFAEWAPRLGVDLDFRHLSHLWVRMSDELGGAARAAGAGTSVMARLDRANCFRTAWRVMVRSSRTMTSGSVAVRSLDEPGEQSCGGCARF